MISDVLSDAVADIRRYLRESPEIYEPIRPWIDAVVAHMDSLRQHLDLPPDLYRQLLEQTRLEQHQQQRKARRLARRAAVPQA